jgi:hypothetical protein
MIGVIAAALSNSNRADQTHAGFWLNVESGQAFRSVVNRDGSLAALGP